MSNRYDDVGSEDGGEHEEYIGGGGELVSGASEVAIPPPTIIKGATTNAEGAKATYTITMNSSVNTTTTTKEPQVQQHSGTGYNIGVMERFINFEGLVSAASDHQQVIEQEVTGVCEEAGELAAMLVDANQHQQQQQQQLYQQQQQQHLHQLHHQQPQYQYDQYGRPHQIQPQQVPIRPQPAGNELMMEMEDPEDSEEEAGGTGRSEKRAGRRKIRIEYIEDKSRRHITFSKRKAGIMKKVGHLVVMAEL